MTEHESHLEITPKITNSLSQSRYKEALRGIMNGNMEIKSFKKQPHGSI